MSLKLTSLGYSDSSEICKSGHNKHYSTDYIPFLIRDARFLIITEAVIWRCSVEKVFLEITQNSQENTCAKKARKAKA